MSDHLIMVLRGEIWKGFRPNVAQPLLENIDRRSRNDGNCKRIPVFFDPYRKGRTPSPCLHNQGVMCGNYAILALSMHRFKPRFSGSYAFEMISSRAFKCVLKFIFELLQFLMHSKRLHNEKIILTESS